MEFKPSNCIFNLSSDIPILLLPLGTLCLCQVLFYRIHLNVPGCFPIHTSCEFSLLLKMSSWGRRFEH